MISYLRIRNYGIFQDQELELGPGLTVFSGETGAGKSMIVDAVMACMGYRASGEVIRAGEERAILEVLITLEPERDYLAGIEVPGQGDFPRELVLQRDILPERSYIRINGRISTMSAAQEIASRVLDIHGQQEHHSLLRPDTYVGILDAMKKDSAGPLKEVFSCLYRERQKLVSEIAGIAQDSSSRKREIDLLSYQVNEIAAAKLCPGEEEALRQEYRILSYQKRLLEMTSEAYRRLYEGGPGTPAVMDELGESIAILKKAGEIDPRSEKALKALEEVSYSLEVAIDLLREYQKGLSVEPERLKEVEERLDLIQRLKSKYGETVERIMSYAEEASKRLDTLARAEEILREFQDRKHKIEAQLVERGLLLSRLRKEIALRMEENVSRTLGLLGMPGARFTVSVEREKDPSGILIGDEKVKVFPDGFDRVHFSFSANPGEPPMPLHKVASGGELSRLMLAIKSYMAETDPVPTLIFDEIDAGIGGAAGQAVAEKLAELGRTHQVLCVTHLASIAAMADSHLVVSKHETGGRTMATVKRVTGEERVHEIARMLSGRGVGISLEHAREMLRAAGVKKSL